MVANSEKDHLSVAICGHVDSCKSTTTGRLIYELGGLPERELEKLNQETDANFRVMELEAMANRLGQTESAKIGGLGKATSSEAAADSAQKSAADQEGGFHTPDPRPDPHFGNDQGQVWSTVSGARMRLLQGFANSSSENHRAAESLATGASDYTGTTASAELTNSEFQASARQQPLTPPIIAPINGVESSPSSTVGPLQERLKNAPVPKLLDRYKELVREVLAEQAAEAQVQATLDAELAELKHTSTEEANSINDLFHQIGGAGRFLRDELHDMDETRVMLQAELQNEESHRIAWESQARSEEEQLTLQVETQQRQLEDMEISRQCMQMHLDRMMNMQAWLRGDLADIRRTQGNVQVVGTQHYEERKSELEQVNAELSLELKEQRSCHDTLRAQLAEEVFRLRQENKRQTTEEQQLSEHIASCRRALTEECQDLHEIAEARREEDEVLTVFLNQKLEEFNEWESSLAPSLHAEYSSLASTLQGEEQDCIYCRQEIDFCIAVVEATQRNRSEVMESLTEEARSTTLERIHLPDEMVQRGRSPEAQQDIGKLKAELNLLNWEVSEARSRHKVLGEEEMEAMNRGILGRLVASCQRRRQPPSPMDAPPMPPPSSQPIRDEEGGPYAFREGP